MKNKKNEEKDPPPGKDEMNLAEYPITLLSHRHQAKVKTIEISDTIIGEGGKPIKREWVVTGSDKFGLPLAADNDLLMAILAIGKENNFKNPQIHFSRYRLLELMGWGFDGRAYRRVEDGFNRISGIRIYAKNAFWDNEKKGYHTINFGIIDAFDLFDSASKNASGQDSFPFSYIVLNSVFFKNIKEGYIKNIDLKIYYKLESAITKRLLRYLDKKRYDGKKQFSINLSTLAYNHIGFDKTTYKKPSLIKQKLDPAHEELIQAGFLKSAEYQKTSDGISEKVIYTFVEKKIQKALPVPQKMEAKKAQQEKTDGTKEEQRQKVESYLKGLTPGELAELRKEAEERARQEGSAIFKDREVSSHVLNSYIHILVEKRLEKQC